MLLVLYARSLHVDSPPHKPSLTSSYVHGTSSISLLPLTVGQILDSTVQRWPDREAVVFPQDGIRKTFSQFQQDVRLSLLCLDLLLSGVFMHVSTLKHYSCYTNESPIPIINTLRQLVKPFVRSTCQITAQCYLCVPFLLVLTL